MEPISHSVGRFVHDLSIADIPPGVIDKAKLVFLDTLGVALESSTMDFGGMVTRVAVRPHNLTLTADNAEAQALADQGYNLFAGIIERRIYFGESADYTVDCAPYPFRLRVVGPPSRLYYKGQKIFAVALPEHCVVVSDK